MKTMPLFYINKIAMELRKENFKVKTEYADDVVLVVPRLI